MKTGQAEREKIVENTQVGECFGGKSDISDYHRKASWSIDSVRIDVTLFGLIQLTHYHRKASWSIHSMSPCSNRCDAIRFDSTDSLSSQSIMVNQFNIILVESIRCNSVNSIDSLSLQSIMVNWFNVTLIESIQCNLV